MAGCGSKSGETVAMEGKWFRFRFRFRFRLMPPRDKRKRATIQENRGPTSFSLHDRRHRH